MWDPYADIQKATLDNGIDVYVAQWDRPWEKCVFLFHCGAKDDPIPGTAHFAEHLICMNVPGRTRKDINREIEDCGGFANFGSTYISGMTFGFQIPAEEFVGALACFARMLRSPRLTRGIEEERRVIAHEFHQRYASTIIYDILLRRRRAIFGRHWLGRFTTPLGSLEGIHAIDSTCPQAFVDRYFVGGNLSIVLCGCLPPDDVVRTIAASEFASIPPGERAKLLEPVRQPLEPTERRVTLPYGELFTTKPGDSGIECYLAIPSGHLRKVASASIAASVTRRQLFEEIRERRGWTYGFDVTMYDLDAATECNIAGRFPWNHLNDIEDIVDACIERAIVDEDEIIRRIRLEQRVGWRMEDLNGAEFLSGITGQLRTEQRVTSWGQDQVSLETLRVSDVLEILHRFRREHRFTFLLGE